MKTITLTILMSFAFTQEFDIDGNLRVQGEIIFQDSSSISTAPNGVPTGVLMPFAGETAPEGWFLCDGSSVSRDDYSILFSVIGEIYGSDDATSFNLPDLRGRMPLGLDNMGGESADVVLNEEADNLGGKAGEESHMLTIDEMPNHNHEDSVRGATNGSCNNHGCSEVTGIGTAQTSFTGGDQPHNNMSPYLSLNFIIKY
ncbi:MAG: tail fiber protein [Candidatus Marinimicrobia bacterium]|nr:tail fiber protein [Candidatus Neomarinimicrobiota bacterium]